MTRTIHLFLWRTFSGQDDQQMPLTSFQRSWCLEMMDKMCRKEISIPFQQEMAMKYGLHAAIGKILANPMDLGLVRQRLESGFYETVQEWGRDVRLIWASIQQISRKGTVLHEMAIDLSRWFEKKFAHFPRSKSEKWINDFNEVKEALTELVKKGPENL